MLKTTAWPLVVTTTFASSDLPSFAPLKGISYSALPCTVKSCGTEGLASEDLMQEGYSMQWGPQGRNDLAVMKSLGANTVRLYHSLGLGIDKDHGAFLDHAESLGLNVMPGFHTENAHEQQECPNFDCYYSWKEATLNAFKNGFKKDGEWHPAVSTLIILNEPDYVEHTPQCTPSGPWCRVKAAISAFDGILAAEKEAGVPAGRVKLSITWSFAIKKSIDGQVEGPGIFGFQDVVAALGNPAIVNYQPRTSQMELQSAYLSRWVHSLNTQSPWEFVDQQISKEYSRFGHIPWFIGEYGAQDQDAGKIQADLESMLTKANSPGATFVGTAFFQFQTAYWKSGSALNYGLFSLGNREFGRTGTLCDKVTPKCRQWPIHCLSTKLNWLHGDTADRAKAVAAAWGANYEEMVNSTSFCDADDEAHFAPGEGEGPVDVIVETTTTQPKPRTTRAPLAPGELPPLKPLRGIAYGALPCIEHDCGGHGRPSEDMVQSAYSLQWGAHGRDDLNTMVKLGASAVRLYHSLGLGVDSDHGAFLDRAQEIGLNVMPGYHTEMANEPDLCPGFDCYETWKNSTLEGFRHGFKKSNEWHPSVAMLVLLNEPDFFEMQPKCIPKMSSWCRVKAVLSALDGVLAAEEEAGIKEKDRVRLTVTWSFAMKTSVDGKVTGPGTYGFQDMHAIVDDPSLADYKPRMPLAKIKSAFNNRWVHGLNTAAPWSFVDEKINQEYQWSPIPWFIGEYGGMGQPKNIIEADLVAMDQTAQTLESFLGAAFFQFQVTYWKGGQEMNFGLFSLGESVLGTSTELCDRLTAHDQCRTWDVHCLSERLPFLHPEEVGLRAAGVAAAWGGEVPTGHGFCGSDVAIIVSNEEGERRLASDSTHIEFTVSNPDMDVNSIRQKLKSASFSSAIVAAVSSSLGQSSAIQGTVSVSDLKVVEVEGAEGSKGPGMALPTWGAPVIGALGGALVLACIGALLLSRRGRKARAARDLHAQPKRNDDVAEVPKDLESAGDASEAVAGSHQV